MTPTHPIRFPTVSLFLLTAFLVPAPDSGAFTYVTSVKNPSVVVHPAGYDGTGGELVVTLALHPDFAEMADEVDFSATQAAAIWSSLLIWDENLAPSIEIPEDGGTDFFGTLVHELGHMLGLGHPTLIPEGLELRRGRGKFSTASPGPNGRLDLDEGEDGLRGSADDQRGDDINAVFFKIEDNNPFTLPANGVFDSTTYSLDVEKLPPGHTWPIIGSREVASEIYSREHSENIMVSGGSLTRGQVRRGLTPDDVAGIRYAMSGLDEIQGTSDDYTLEVEYLGVSDEADVIIRFDLESGYAVAAIGTRPISGNHTAMGTNRHIRYNPNPPRNRKWYFPQPEPADHDAQTINPRAFSLNIATETGKRYGITWPTDTLAADEQASEIIVQHQGENRGALSRQLFLFDATDSQTEIKIAFPSTSPDLSQVKVFQLTAREAN